MDAGLCTRICVLLVHVSVQVLFPHICGLLHTCGCARVCVKEGSVIFARGRLSHTLLLDHGCVEL